MLKKFGMDEAKAISTLMETNGNLGSDASGNMVVAPGFKNKTRYIPYVSLGNQISHIATNKGNVNRQCSIYNVLSIKNIILYSKQRKDNSDLQVKTPIPQIQLTG